MNIILVAGGLNTRFNEYAIFPKILLPYKNNDSILIDFYKKAKDHTLFVLINERYYKMLTEYIRVNKLEIQVIKTTNTNGSYNTIASIKKYLPKTDMLFVWSDLIIDCKTLDLTDVKTNYPTIYTKDGGYRFKISHGKLSQVDPISAIGNVPGIYYLPNSTDIDVVHEESLDLLEYLWNNMSVGDKPFKYPILEFRDKEVYEKFIKSTPKNENVPRFFNSIEIIGNILIKRGIDPKYRDLIRKETSWYKKLSQGDPTRSRLMPKLYSYDDASMVMEYLEGYETIHHYIERTGDYSIIDHEIRMLNLLHEEEIKVDKDIVLNDITQEFYYKTCGRIGSIQDMLIRYDDKEFSHYVEVGFDYLKSQLVRDKYSFIHGDTNGSNVMVHPKTKDIKFIDPRGYFGNTALYGLPEYDFAKVKYFLCGYDDFNLNHYLYSDINYDKPKICGTYTHDKLDGKLNKVMVGFIYLNLASYISNNIMKANIAYEHGMNILKENLS